jgi:hypothetical protein
VRIWVPSYAVHRSGSGYWLIRAPSDDPFMPAVRVVEVIADRGYARIQEPRSSGAVIRAFRAFDRDKPQPQPRAEVDDRLHRELLELADLLGRLNINNIETFCLQRACLARQLRRAA